MIVATEASGDDLAARLIERLRASLGPGARVVGVGGPRMAAAGVVSPFDPASIAILGVFNAVAAYPLIRRRVRETAALAARERPDAAILVDSWGFTLRVARSLRRLDPRMLLIKYVGPQVWATRPGRTRTLAAAVDHLLTIHAFDAPMFEAAGLATTFVGNPVLTARQDPPTARSATPLLLVLPGSRPSEIKRLMRPFGEAAARLKRAHPDLEIVIGAAASVADAVRAGVAAWPVTAEIIDDKPRLTEAMKRATVALACSGTVTTELAAAGCPMVVAYRLGPFTYAVAIRLARTPYVTLFNIAARAFVAPELIQGDCTPAKLASAVHDLLADRAKRDAQAAAQSAALDIMRGGIDNPVEAAALAVEALLRSRGLA